MGAYARITGLIVSLFRGTRVLAACLKTELRFWVERSSLSTWTPLP